MWGPYIYIHGNMMGEVQEKVSGLNTGVFLEWSMHLHRNVKRNVSETMIGLSRELLLG